MRRKMAAWGTAIALVIAGCAFAYWHAWVRVSNDVEVPPDDASAEAVVKAYVDAIDGHDCETARDLWTDDAGYDDTWCDDISTLRLLEVSQPFNDYPKTHLSAVEAVRVGVTLDIGWRPFHYDASLGQGQIGWGYLLVRETTASPWRLAGEGEG